MSKENNDYKKVKRCYLKIGLFVNEYAYGGTFKVDVPTKFIQGRESMMAAYLAKLSVESLEKLYKQSEREGKERGKMKSKEE